jgi:hypothetical protein
MSQKERENRIKDRVKADHNGLEVSPRYARERLDEAQRRK